MEKGTCTIIHFSIFHSHGQIVLFETQKLILNSRKQIINGLVLIGENLFKLSHLIFSFCKTVA